MKKNFKTILAGATYFSIGYASAHPDCLILESSHGAGVDFHTATVPVIGEIEEASDLAQMMKEYGVLKNNKLDVLKAAPVIHKYLSVRDDISVLLNAEILSVKKTDGGYIVKYITNSGISELCCEQLIDTTPLRDTYPDGAKCIEKRLNVFTLALTDSFCEKIKEACPTCVITENMLPNEKIITFFFDGGKSIVDAYGEITELWQKAFPNGEEKIVFIAQDFDYFCEAAGEENAPCKWINQHFSNPLSAFQCGRKEQI